MAGVLDQVQLNFSSDSVWLLNVCLGIIMFGVALELNKNDFIRIVKSPVNVLVGLLAQLLVLPFITWLMVVVFQPSPGIALGMFLVAACPGGNVSNFMSSMAKANAALSVSLTAFSTALSIFFTPLNFSFWGSMYAPTEQLMREISLDYLDVFQTIFMILLVPLVLGMLVGHYFPKLTKVISGWIKKLSLLIFGGFIAVAFSNNWEQFISYIQMVFWIVLAHNAVAFAAGNLVGRLGRLSARDVKTITIETGIQNSGLALLLIFNFFDGLGGMALIAACWGIWDLFSGSALAYLLSRYPSVDASKV